MTKGEQTRQRLVMAAAKVFNQRGYQGSSMQDIMQATGLEKGGIYRHFSSKEELAKEAFDYAWRTASQARAEHLDEIENTLERLKRYVANFVEVRSAIPGGCPLMNTAVEADDGSAALRTRALGALRGWRKRLGDIVQQGVKRGDIRKDADPESVATIVISCLEGALMMSRLERSSKALVHAQRHLNAYFDSLVRG